MPYSALPVLESPGFAPQQSDWIKNGVKCCCWSFQNRSESKRMQTYGIRITVFSLGTLVINNCYNCMNIKGLCSYCEIFRSPLQFGLLWGADEPKLFKCKARVDLCRGGRRAEKQPFPAWIFGEPLSGRIEGNSFTLRAKASVPSMWQDSEQQQTCLFW